MIFYPLVKTSSLGALNRQPKAVDLYSGCGGMTQGLKLAGFQVIGAVDIDPLSVETYRANHKNVAIWETDIRSLSVAQVKLKLGLHTSELDLLAGCPPCQGFSSIRTRNGGRRVRDPQNKDLVLDFMRFVRGLRPKVVMLENVPGLAKDWRFKEILKELLTLGYLYEYRILNAADYGVPQRRKRLILIASRVGEPNFASPRPSHRTVRQTIYGLQRPGKSGDPLHDIKEERSKRIVEMIRRIPKNGGSRKDAGKKYQLECHKNFDGFKDVYGRMSWDDVSPTITGGCVNPSKGRFLHPSQNRTITLREAALLQSFPATYHFSLNKGKYAAAVMIGNALPPKFIRRQAQIIYKLLEKQEGIGDK